MNWQQKVWKGTAVIWHACCPLFLYLIMPGIAMQFGKIIRSYARSNEDFIAESGNFYTFIGTLAVGVILYRHARKKETTIFEEATLSLENINKKLLILCILAGTLISLFISSVLTIVRIPYLSDDYSQTASVIYGRTDLILVCITVGFLGPVIEEIIFRGYMLNRLLTYFDERTSVIVTAGIFALCHVNLIWIVYSFIIGIFLGKLSIVKDNIIYAVFIHIGFNMLSVIIAIINSLGLSESFFFNNKLLIICYGLIGLAAGRLCLIDIKEEVGK